MLTNVEPSKHQSPSSSDSDEDDQPISILKKRKTNPTDQMRDQTDTVASLKALVVLGVAAHPFNTTIEYYSDTESVSISPQRGDSPLVHS